VSPSDKASENLKERIVRLEHGLKPLREKYWDWVKLNPLKAVLGALTSLALLWPLLSFVFNHISADLGNAVDRRIDAKLSETNKKLGELDQKTTAIGATLNALQPFIEDLVKRQMDKAASLPQSRFNANLPALGNLISVARNQRIVTTPGIVNQVGEKLRGVTERGTDFWHLGGEFLSYRSFNTASDKARILPASALPKCTDSPPKPMKVLNVESPNQMTVSRGYYENCQVTLDSSEDDQRINSILKESTPLLTFRRCLILYRGGPVDLILTWEDHRGGLTLGGKVRDTIVSVSGNALEFEDCYFVFSIPGIPPPSGQQITETLIAQNGPTLKLPHP
jgi:hypothetical protein